MTTNEYVQGVNERGWAPFDRRLWQRTYYDHVIRDEDELRHVRQYILANPTKWAEDVENPHNIRAGPSSLRPRSGQALTFPRTRGGRVREGVKRGASFALLRDYPSGQRAWVKWSRIVWSFVSSEVPLS